MRTFRSSQASAFRKLKELSIHHRNSSAVNYRKLQYNFNRNQSCTFCCIIDASIILRSEINGKVNVTNYWVSSRDRGLKFRDLSWILRFFWLLRTRGSLCISCRTVYTFVIDKYQRTKNASGKIDQ